MNTILRLAFYLAAILGCLRMMEDFGTAVSSGRFKAGSVNNFQRREENGSMIYSEGKGPRDLAGLATPLPRSAAPVAHEEP